MKNLSNANRILYYSPRVLTIIFALFLSIFSFDVLDMDAVWWRKLLALLIHLIPSFIITISLIIAWKKEFMGAMLFFSLALGYILMAWSRLNIYTVLLIAGPLILIGVLFLINDRMNKKEELTGETPDTPEKTEAQ